MLNNEISKINTLLSLNPIGLKNLIGGTELSNMLQNNVINIDVFNEKDEELISAFKRINEELEQLLSKINELREKVIKMNVELAKNINKTKKYINNFLKIAGIPYCIDIVFNNDNSSRTIMKPINIDYEIDNPQNRLSYGEKNAISLVLFAVEIHSKNPNLVILDDPVSSFDSNKKYALMHYLFAEKNSYFNNKTVLFLTHDISPIIDFIKLNSFNGVNVIAHHLTNRNGNVTESQIKSSDIDSSINLEKQSAKDQTKNLIFRLAHLRRYYELLNMFGLEYNLISSLLHCYPKPQKKIEGNLLDMSEDEISYATKSIKDYISDFDYNNHIKKFTDNNYLKEEYIKGTQLEKLNIVRVYIDNNNGNPQNDICWRFICDSYHIENVMLFNIVTNYYNNVPDYIIKICDHIMEI